MKIFSAFIFITSLIIVGCTYLETEDNKAIACFELDQEDYQVEPVPLETSIPDYKPNKLILKGDFIEKLKSTYLWNETNDPEEYGYNFSFESLNSFLQLLGDGYSENSESVIEVRYSPLIAEQRNKYGHKLLASENKAMTEIINIVIDDHHKSTEILNQLYKQYLIKLENNELLSDGETIHTFIKYDGKYFELWGISRKYHRLSECNFDMLSGISIR